MSNKINLVGVIGAGSWGTALATTIARAGRDVVLWARSDTHATAIAAARENKKYLPGVKLPQNITVTNDIHDFSDCDAVLMVSPAQAQRAVMSTFSNVLKKGIPALICSKGIEQSSNLFMSDVLAEVAPDLEAFVLSGPSFAADVVRGLPTAVTLAGPDIESAKTVAQAIGHANFRIYASDDIVGVQIGGAVKNVLAIACGISDGKNLGESCRAALITRAFSELTRLGNALGARPETLVGLSGFGDLSLTCSSPKSRNYSLGFKLGQGEPLKQILGASNTVSEGVFTAGVVVDIARKNNIEMPICEAVHAIVDGQSDPDTELARLLARPMRAEIE
ncbi:Glycerol-3-phosphate dehydrogenase [NAD(P)+] [hydrothermal vent metagenome]|uniref:Glycerol-3-phosphate dehydrogenase [NAD(P)+] n=1 Tax=hydrothermal vent metagenome TaxID=652676 RepID=A0A3B0RIA7_9ZZZZ